MLVMLLCVDSEAKVPVLPVRCLRGGSAVVSVGADVDGEREMGHAAEPKSRCVESCADGASEEHQGQVGCFCSQPENWSLEGQVWRLWAGEQDWTRCAQRCWQGCVVALMPATHMV